MTKLEELKAAAYAAYADWAVYEASRNVANDAAYWAAYDDAWDARNATWAAYQAELKKIMAPTVEMTMAQINEALGKNVKVVE